MAHKFLFTIMTFMLSFVSTMQVSAQRQYLHEGWSFGQARLANRYPAQVPGVVHTDLLRLGLIDDPYIGLNERKVHLLQQGVPLTFAIRNGNFCKGCLLSL